MEMSKVQRGSFIAKHKQISFPLVNQGYCFMKYRFHYLNHDKYDQVDLESNFGNKLSKEP